MKPVSVARWDDLIDRKPAGALVANVDLVIVRYEDKVSVLYGRCLHRGALLEDGHVDGDNLICCLLYTSPSPRDLSTSRMPSSA